MVILLVLIPAMAFLIHTLVWIVLIDKVTCQVVAFDYTILMIPQSTDFSPVDCDQVISTPNYLVNATVMFQSDQVWYNKTLCHFKKSDECFWCVNEVDMHCRLAKTLTPLYQSYAGMPLFACEQILLPDMSTLTSYDIGNTFPCWVNRHKPEFVFEPFSKQERRLDIATVALGVSAFLVILLLGARFVVQLHYNSQRHQRHPLTFPSEQSYEEQSRSIQGSETFFAAEALLYKESQNSSYSPPRRVVSTNSRV